jgi:hypothetical protein
MGLHVIQRKMAYFVAQWSILLHGAEKENMKMKVISLEALAHAPWISADSGEEDDDIC